jgi:hypothetical protein
VHPDPGKDVGIRNIILVVWLVHVPDEGYVKRVVGHGDKDKLEVLSSKF